jgi:hypothetical protein
MTISQLEGRVVILPLQTWGKQGYGPILARNGLGGYADGGAAESQVYEGGAMVKICLLVLLIAAPASFAGRVPATVPLLGP